MPQSEYEECYNELSKLWGQYPIVEDYKNTLSKKSGYEKWIDSDNIDLFIANNYDFDDEQDKIIEKYYGEEWDVTAEFPEWCRRFFGGYWYDDFAGCD